MNQKGVTAIIVAYLPNDRVIVDAIESICEQVDSVLIVDNTPGGSDVFQKENFLTGKKNVGIISLSKNLGIAAAQNIGIRRALSDGAEFILLSDQDTRYPGDYVSRMLEAYFVLAERKKIAAIVPNFSELNRGGVKQGFVLFAGIFSKRIYPQTGCREITQAIASGMIVPSDVFRVVGTMDEELFIDWVDLEWCWRARKKGYAIIGCADVVIEHSLGDEVKRLGAQVYPMRSPLRHYYIVRNAVHLALRNPYITLGMRVNIFAKSIKYIVGFTLLGRPRHKHFLYSLKGFCHGVVRRLGSYS